MGWCVAEMSVVIEIIQIVLRAGNGEYLFISLVSVDGRMMMIVQINYLFVVEN